MSAGEPTTPMYRMALGLCVPIVRWWGRLEVEGLEHLPAQGPVLLAGNHDSYWDPLVVGIAARGRREIRALAKSSLWKVKGMSRMLDAMGQIPIVRGSGDVDALQRAISELRGGACVGIFPEGTRSLTPGLLRANPGVALLVARSGAPILPVAVTGTERLDSVAHFLFARPRGARVRVVIGEPFRPSVPTGKLDHQALADQIMVELAKLLPPAYRGAYAAADAVDD